MATPGRESVIATAAIRSPDVEGSHNLRDLGALPAAGGQRIRKGLVFRSGSLERLTPAGIDQLLALGIGMIFDFRSASEREHAPTLWLAHHDIARWQLGATASLGDPRPLLAQSFRSAEKTRTMMRNVYRDLPVHHRQSYSSLFQALARNDHPILFHCAAGKDRTGVAAALLLALLGVDRPAIDDDYQATNQVIDATTQMFLSDPRNDAALSSPSETWAPMMTADPSYLDEMFDAVLTVHGSVEAYARTALGLSTSDIERLRSRLCE